MTRPSLPMITFPAPASRAEGKLAPRLTICAVLGFLAMFLVPAAVAPAERVQVSVRSASDLDRIGPQLRQAINAYEAAQAAPSLPVSWTQVEIAPGQALDLGDGHLLMMQAQGWSEPELVLLTPGETHRARLAGRTGPVELGPLEVTPVEAGYAGGGRSVLLRAKDGAGEREPLRKLLAERAVATNVRIEGYESPPRFAITARDERTLAFARRFVEEMRAGRTAEQAAERAWEAHPPSAPAVRAMRGYQSPQRAGTPPYPGAPGYYAEDDFPHAAQVTLHLVRAESSALNQLLSEISYDSAGNRPENPRVQGRTGGRGADVQIGSPGDRFEARLRALERTGRLRVESESLAYVPLGGWTTMTMAGPSEALSARLGARQQGQHIYLDVDQRSRGWEALGSVSTVVRLRDGQTLPLARNTYQRREEATSGPPIFSGVPYLGPLFGASQRSSLMSEYALFATVHLN